MDLMAGCVCRFEFCFLCVIFMVRCHVLSVFFFQAEDGIRDLVRSRGLGDVYKRQGHAHRYWVFVTGNGYCCA